MDITDQALKLSVAIEHKKAEEEYSTSCLNPAVKPLQFCYKSQLELGKTTAMV